MYEKQGISINVVYGDMLARLMLGLQGIGQFWVHYIWRTQSRFSEKLSYICKNIHDLYSLLNLGFYTEFNLPNWGRYRSLQYIGLFTKKFTHPNVRFLCHS